MLAVKRRPALLDQFAGEMPLTRSIRQRLEEEEEQNICYRSGGTPMDDSLQLEGKDAQKGHTPSFALAADGSSAALRRSKDATPSGEIDAAVGPAVQQIAALAAGESTQQAQHGAQSGRGGAPAAPFSEQSSDNDSLEDTDTRCPSYGPALRCRVYLPNEIEQSPMRTRSQDLSEIDVGHLSSSTVEEPLHSSAAFEDIQQQQDCGATPQPSSNTQKPTSPGVRHHRISLTLGATDGGVTTSDRRAAATLKSCIRKESTIQSTDIDTPGLPALSPGSPVTRSRSLFQQGLVEQDQQQQQEQQQQEQQQAQLQLREGLLTRQSVRAASQASRRVRFSDGPLQDRYATPDGHPNHEGQTARQRRSLNTSYPVDLTPHSIRMLEQELGESYRLSINRLKRRVGLLPRVSRPREYVTKPRPAPKPRQIPAGLPALRALRPRLPLYEDSDDSGDESCMHDSDSPTSSSTLTNDAGTPTKRLLRSTASSVDGAKAAWTANSGGVRHGAARSISGSRRKSTAPSRARPQSPLHGANFAVRPDTSSEPLSRPQEQVMKKPASPRTPRHGRGLFGRAASPRKAEQQPRLGAAQTAAGADSPDCRAMASLRPSRAAGQLVPPIFQSPRKRPSSLTVAEDGPPRCPPRSPRRQQPVSTWHSSSLLGSVSNALKPSALLALPTPLPQQQSLLLRSTSVKASLAKAADPQEAAEKGGSTDSAKQACQPGSSAAAKQPAGSADVAKQAPDEAPRMGRRLRSADSLRQWDRAADADNAAPSLRAAIYDSILSHTRLLRSSLQ